MPEPIGDLRGRVQRHNRLMLAQTIGCAAAAPLFWALAFALVWWFVTAMLVRGVGIDRAFRIGSIVAGGAALALIVEAIRLIVRDQRDSPDVSASSWDQIVSADDSLAARSLLGHAVFAGVVAETLLFGPRAVARAVRAWRQRVSAGEAQVQAMERVVAQLQAARGWVPASQLGSNLHAVLLLRTMGLVWIKPRDEQVMVRIAPSYCP